MKRTMEILIGGNTYILSERRRMDANYNHLTEKMRKHNLGVIQQNITDRDQALSLLMVEMKRVYTAEEIKAFSTGNIELKYEIVFNSLKINHAELTLAKVIELLDDTDIDWVCSRIYLLEGLLDAANEDEKKN